MEVPGFSLRSGSKLRRLSEALREGQFAIGNGRGDEFLRQERETEIRGRRENTFGQTTSSGRNMCVLGAMTISGGYTLALRCYALVSSKLRLLRYANAARGWDCRGCVCAGVHWHCQGTQPHSTRITTRAFHSNLNCISCILYSGRGWAGYL